MTMVSFWDKKKKKELTLNYIKSQVRKGHCPSHSEIEKTFHLHIPFYFKNVKGMYERAGFSYTEIKKLKIIQKSRLITEKKRRFEIEKGREKIIAYIRKEAKGGHFPGLDEIQKHFSISLGSYFKNIKYAYKTAKINLEKRKPNPFIGLEKEERLIRISINLLENMDYRIVTVNRNNGADLIVKDLNNFIIPVELKAYHRNVNIPISNIFGDYENEIEQLRKYINIHKSPYGILITTTDRIRLRVPSNIILINGKELTNKLMKYGLSKHLPSLNWIKDTYSSFDRGIHESKVREKIITYIQNQVSKKHYPSMREIQHKFKINIRIYFPGNMSEAYQIANVELPCRYLSKRKVKERISNYINWKVENGKYPSLEEIEKKFRIHIRTYFKSPKEMYKFAKVDVPCKHLNKNEAREVILSYVKENISKGKNIFQREIGRRFNIDVYSYFKNMDKLMKLSKNS